MFRSFGHENSSIINGGLPQWVEDGLPTESGAATGDVQHGNYPPPKFNDQAIRSENLKRHIFIIFACISDHDS